MNCMFRRSFDFHFGVVVLSDGNEFLSAKDNKIWMESLGNVFNVVSSCFEAIVTSRKAMRTSLLASRNAPSGGEPSTYTSLAGQQFGILHLRYLLDGFLVFQSLSRKACCFKYNHTSFIPYSALNKNHYSLKRKRYRTNL